MTMHFNGNDFDTEHEAICSALFIKYGWRWERPKHPLSGWLPDFLLKGDISVWVECKGGLKWEDAPNFPELQRYEDAVSGTSDEVLLIPESPKTVKKRNGYTINALGYLYDGELWSYAELGRWTSKVGFCHSARLWRDRMSGEDVGKSSGDEKAPDISLDWLYATKIVRGKRVSFFKEDVTSELQEWNPR